MKIHKNGGTVGVVLPSRGAHCHVKGVQYPPKLA